MLCRGPIYVHRHAGRYRCVWTPVLDGAIQLHGIGVADMPGVAIGRAYADAVRQGWTAP